MLILTSLFFPYVAIIMTSCPLKLECPLIPCPNVEECKRVTFSITLDQLESVDTPESLQEYNNPYSLDAEANWCPYGTKFINGELVIISE
jgi:hypothetical protein